MRHNIYIHTDLEDRFKAEKNIGALINDLLREEWGVRKERAPETGAGFVAQHNGENQVIFSAGKIRRTCKKGHTYTGEKCLQKGCA